MVDAENSRRKRLSRELSPFVPTNLYPIERLPTYFNRVAVLLVITPDPASPVLEFVDEIFHQELAREEEYSKQFA